MNDLQKYIHLSKYARWREEDKRRETWEETVDRYITFISNRVPTEHHGQLILIKEEMMKLGVVPSMRALMTAGEAAIRDNAAMYNCSYVAVDNPRVFDEIFYLLMCGSGVGFSVERQFVTGSAKMIEVADNFFESDTTIVVADSKIGWASALRELISLLYIGKVPKWDLSKIRPAGARLKVFGGRASGPAPLDALFKYVVSLFRVASGRKLNSIECHDLICKIANTVIVGSVRRSACISFSNLTDQRMAKSKAGSWWIENPERALANNSVMFTEKPDLASFTKEMHNLYESKCGERGIVNQKALKLKAIECGRDPEIHYGLNPCLIGSTVIHTVDGPMMLKDIVKPTNVYSMGYDGSLCIRKSTASWVSKRDTETVVITYNNGKSITVTPDHKIYVLGATKGKTRGIHSWVEAKDLKIGDRLNALSRTRRGAGYVGIKLSTDADYRMEHRLVYEGMYGPIPHGHDIHHMDDDGYHNSIGNLELISHSKHSSLTRYTRSNNHMIWDSVTGKFLNQGGTKKKVIIPFPLEWKLGIKGGSLCVASVTPGPVVDVYDMSVEDTHNFVADGIIVHNCAEAILRSSGLCNLSESIIRPDDTLEDIKRKVTFATILGTIQSTYTDFRYLRKIWKDNAEEERLLGVSLTGICDHPIMSGKEVDCAGEMYNFCGYEGASLKDILVELRNTAKDTNREWAAILGINESKQIGLVKPSGTVSQLADCSSGIHPRYSKYYIRRVTQDNKDPLTQLMIDQGIPYVLTGDKTIFSFYCKAPDTTVMQKDMDAIQQLELWSTYQKHWCDGNPSQSIYYQDDNFLDVCSWVWKNWDSVGGLSFFPYNDHCYDNAPYEALTKEEYSVRVSSFPTSVEWGKLGGYETEDCTVSSQTMACSGGACDLL